MPTFDASRAQCLVFTYKEGMLSGVAHDLQLQATSFSIEAEAGAVEARLDPKSLTVVSAMKDGKPSDGLKDKDKRDIEANLRKDVLETHRHAEIRFASRSVETRGQEIVVSGDLSLHGVTRPLEIRARRAGGRITAEVELNQPDYGIKPFSALLGTLKVKPRVMVRVSIPDF